ncbi:uncharacterized protein LOC110617507 [Manihot esculenta]|uniref:Uncharacterized protein n=2 Tax=Manihot esculenta TaxID=3983 RepID=A0A2C9WN06_MANES|nr:uncharacterized protein LOC110617507 [Manihot esculenta]KAG8662760.1 hypothetical protein MANES_01G140500v8 [Manihot esculenta]OAY60806.1 hypothetical protein MANES_01G140500v8 [Manihot esculenta]
MGFTALRSIIRPLSRTLTFRTSCSASTSPTTSFLCPPLSPKLEFRFAFHQSPFFQISRHFSIFSEPNHFDRLTDSRLPKRRPQDEPRRKRAYLRPPGPYAWVKHVPGQPIQPSNPNEGSVKRRNEKKRIKQHRAFIKSEAKKRKAQLQEAKRKKIIKRVERKMATVARERAWAERLKELQQLEEEKKKSMA